MQTLEYGDITERGFLSDPEEWSHDVAGALAKAEGVELTDAHWVVLNAIRDFYGANETSPSYHIICQEVISQDVEKVSAPFSYNCVHAMKQLFPSGGLKQAARIAGLPDYFCFGC
jgi:tRNA 2-thiouridine synthesizing protein E